MCAVLAAAGATAQEQSIGCNEGNAMALMMGCSRSRSVWIVASCALACVWMQTSVAFAQQRGPVGRGHVGGGHAGVIGPPSGGRVSAPRGAVRSAPPATIPRPPVAFRQRAGFGQRVGFGPRPIFPRHRVFLRAPFFAFPRGPYPGWWLNCGYLWIWDLGCGYWRLPEYGAESYVAPPPLIYEYPVYVYGGDHEFVQLFLKDDTAYSVTDYWFVNDEVHFTVLEEGGTKSVEQVIGLDELDVPKTIDVNARRGFRVVRRDEPVEQYLRNHPDANPPLLEPPPKN